MNKFFLASAVALLVSTGAAVAETDCHPSLAQYNKLEIGMTYRTVVSSLGCEGRETRNVDVGKFTTQDYEWDGYGFRGANMFITVMDGKLFFRAQFGLK